MGRYTETTEEDIEQYLCRQTKTKLDGRALKYNTPGRRAAPDRILLLPRGKIDFVECKRPGKVPTPKQWAELKRLWDSGHSATWVDTKDQVDLIIGHLLKGGSLTKEFTINLHEVM